MKIKLLLIGIILMSLDVNAQVNTQLVSTNILQRVFLVKYNDSIGTIFTIEVAKKQYLISAKHVFPNIAAQDSVEIFHNKQWEKIPIDIVGEVPNEVDIVVFATNIQLSPTHELIPTDANFYLSQEVFFLGFPFGISTDAGQINNLFPIPFVKRGIISALIDFPDPGKKILLIDGINNKGFSGGPIVLYSFDTKKLQVIGVISGYRTQTDPIKIGNDDTVLQAITNSGILIGYSIEHAVRVINKNPIGYEIK